MAKKNKGFTLIEMIIVISITAILIIMSSLKFNIREKIEAKNQIKEFVTNIEYVRNHAISSGQKRTLKFSENKSGYYFKLPYREVNVKFNKMISIVECNLSGDITFSELGKPSFINKDNSAGKIIFKIKDDKYAVIILPVTGEVRYEKIKE